MREAEFHLSVMKWFSDRDYKFWWELTLPYSRLRPDFLAVAPDGEKMLVECKTDRVRAHLAVKRIPEYLSILNEQAIHAYLVIPDSMYMPPKFVLEFETLYTHVLRIPAIAITNDYECFPQRVNQVNRYFRTFSNAPARRRTSDADRLQNILGKVA